MKLQLEITQSLGKTATFEHAGPRINVGRDSNCQLVLAENEGVSWNHAVIELTPDGAFVRDLESSNGTFVNDKRIEKRTRLEEGDHIRLGRDGPYVKVTVLDLSGAFEKSETKAAIKVTPPMVPAKPDKVVAVAEAAPPKRTLATRVYLSMMESRYRKLWIGSGIGAACFAISFSAILLIYGGSIAWLFGAKSRTDEKVDQIAKSGEQTKLELAEFLAGDAENIRKKYGDAVYIVATKSESSVTLLATAFAVNRSGDFGTNAHVSVSVNRRLKEGKKVWVISPGGKQAYEVTSATMHPRYIHWKKHIEYQTPDVGVLTVQLNGRQPDSVVDLANSGELKALSPGANLCYIGYPGWNDTETYPSMNKIEPRIYAGTLVRLTSLKEESAEHKNQYLLEHNMQNTGGASGSPIFNKHGKVVAVHNSGSSSEVLTKGGSTDIPYGPTWGIRVDLLKELLK